MDNQSNMYCNPFKIWNSTKGKFQIFSWCCPNFCEVADNCIGTAFITYFLTN